MNKPLVAITMGDPRGVGPEIVVRALCDPNVYRACRSLVVGRPELLRCAVQLLRAPAEVVEVERPEETISSPRTIACLPRGEPLRVDSPPLAETEIHSGQASYDALVAAANLAIAGRVQAITTAPLNKAALWAAGHHYPGHTELLAELCAAPAVAMMLYLPPGGSLSNRAGLGVAHVTLHTALSHVPAAITIDAILAKIQLANGLMRSLLSSDDQPPRIGVAALNPHAGEEGLFGDEEQRIIRPAVEMAIAEGLALSGPLPADTLMVRASAGEFDAVVAMYHDQGHVAMKLLGMHRAVNVTLGLPIVRTSVAHGTAFDVAWQGRAESSGMTSAIALATKLIRHQTTSQWKR